MAASSPPDPVRWSQVNRLFEAAIARPPGERRAFVAAQCGSDSSLRADVESLLAAHRDGDTSVHPGVAVGSRLGDYEVTGFIAAGGMGEVYRARDTKLGRDVALKILPAAFVADPDRRARFEREARLIASLNHPHIAGIYGFVQGGDTQALALELIDGETLADRIARGPLPLDEALPIARQIAEALEAAHEQGIIHRDLKPANIKVTADGVVKVLDFGLAKLAHPELSGGRADVTVSPTITSPAMMTGQGVILGTAAYMSPEQAKGREADKRSDVWAFGAVLYEMLTGQRAFEGEDISDTLANVLKVDPDWSRLPHEVPPLIRTLLQRCLEKDRRRRVADVAAIQFALTHAPAIGITREAVAAPPASVAPRPLWRSLAGPAGIVATAAATWAAFTIVQRPALENVTRLTMSVPSDAPVAFSLNFGSLAVAPDGSSVAYLSAPVSPVTVAVRARLLVRRMDAFEPTLVADATEAPRTPFFSSDGAWIGFFHLANAGAGGEDQLKKVPAAGGPSSTIATIDGGARGAAWAPDGMIVFATDSPTSGLQRISADGGSPQVLTRPNVEKGEVDHVWPHMLPDGNAVLFTILREPIEQSVIAVLDLRDGSQKVVLNGGSDARYLPSGHLVYGSVGTLRAVAFDVERLEVRGAPVPVVEQVVTSTGGAANFAVSTDGTLTYVSGAVAGAVAIPRALVWVDRAGREEPLKVPPRTYGHAQLSPDGTRVALDIRDQQNDIWIWDLARDTLQRLTFDPGPNGGGVWAPDGKQVAFTQRVGTVGEIYWQSADGTGKAAALTKDSASNVQPTDFLPDGSAVLYEPANDPRDILMVRTGGSAPTKGTPVLSGPANERAGTVSPDGRWLAYQSDESGRVEIYVRPFPAVDTGRWQISTSGGTRPRWSRDGRELFYIVEGAPLAVMGVSVKAGPSFAAGSPVKIIEGNYVAPISPRLTYDVSLDGKRFLMIKNLETAVKVGSDSPTPQIVIVQNWIEELKRLVPAK